MGSVNSNIFDLSALPSASPKPEPQGNNLPEDSQGSRFDSVLSGVAHEKVLPQDKPTVKTETKQESDGTIEVSAPTPDVTTTINPEQPNAPKVVVTQPFGDQLSADESLINTQVQKLTQSGEQVIKQLISQMENVDPAELAMLSSEADSESIDLNATKVLDNSLPNGKSEITEGKFAVKQVTPKGNEVEILAESLTDPEAKIKLVVPKEELVRLQASHTKTSSSKLDGLVGQNHRVPLEGTPIPTPKLEELLTKLNLKEIEIKNEPTQTVAKDMTQPNANTKTVNLASTETTAEFLVKGEVSSVDEKGRVSLKHRLSPKGVDLNIASNARPVSAVQNPTGDGQSRLALVNTRTQDGELMLQQVKVRSEAVEPVEQFISHEAVDDVTGDKTFSTSVTHETQNATMNGSRLEVPQAKFTLPEDIALALKPGGQAVTIKIHPEILGPVRLSLHMSHGQLRARLIVDSVQVKGMVESSLDQLTNQLHKAGINVDQMEVNVAGSDIGSGWFDRSVAQNRPKMSYRVLEAEEAELLSPMTAATSRSPREYVGAGGVNLFA